MVICIQLNSFIAKLWDFCGKHRLYLKVSNNLKSGLDVGFSYIQLLTTDH